MNIKKYFLITDTGRENPNPGDIMIGKGIEYLLSLYEKARENTAIFNYVNIFSINKNVWNRLYLEADYLIVCGTPHFSMKPNHFENLWPLIRVAKQRGIVCINLWSGVAWPDQAYIKEQAIIKLEKTCFLRLKALEIFDFIIVRDSITHALYTRAGHTCTQLIDCVFFSPNYFNISSDKKDLQIFTVRNCDSNEKIALKFRELSKTYPNPIFLAHDIHDFNQYLPFFGRDLFCVNNPKSLLRLYSRATDVISMRVHGSVPSMNYGAKIINICNDSRSDILAYVGCNSISINQFLANSYKPQFIDVKKIQNIKEQDKQRFFELCNTFG